MLVFPRDNEWPLSGESVHALALPLGFSWHVHLRPLVYLLRETYECHEVFPRSQHTPISREAHPLGQIPLSCKRMSPALLYRYTWSWRWPMLVFPRDNEWPLSGESVHALASSLGFLWHVHLGPLVYLLRETYECHQVFPRSVQLFSPVGSFKTEVIYRAECTKIHLLDPVPG